MGKTELIRRFFVNVLILNWIQWNSITFLAYRTKPNRIKHEFVGFEIFQFLDVFSSSVWSNRTLFYCINDFTWCIWCIWMIFYEKTSKYWKNSIRFDSIRFGSVRFDIPGKLKFHCIILNRYKNLNLAQFGSWFSFTLNI